MRAPIRSQETFEDDGDEFSEKAGTDTGEDTKVRQEFKEESEINSLLERAGLNPLQGRQPIFTETDYTLDLQRAYTAVQEAAAAYQRLPDEIKKQYPSWESVVKAVEAGKLTGLETTKEEPNVPKPEGEAEPKADPSRT